MSFHLTPANNNAGTTLTQNHLLGDTTLYVANTDEFPDEFPFRVTVSNGYCVRTIYEIVAKTDTTLTIGGTLEGTTDQAYTRLDRVQQLFTFGYLQDVEDAINDPQPVPASTVFNADGSITSTRESGQVITTTFLANGDIVDTYGPPINQVKTTHVNADGSITETVTYS